MKNLKALLIGATGLTGTDTLKQLIQSDEYSEVITVSRKQPELKSPKIKSILIDFDNPGNVTELIKVDHVFCSMGSTMAKSGSKEVFLKSDYHYPFYFAQKMKENGTHTFVLVSSLGADSNSPIFYSKTKGQLEDALIQLKFPKLVILRPSILLGARNESRPAEAIGQWMAQKLSFVFAGPLSKYKGISSQAVASCMIQQALNPKDGLIIIENEDI